MRIHSWVTAARRACASVLVYALTKSLFCFPYVGFLTSVILTAKTIDNVVLFVFGSLIFRVNKFLSQCVIWFERHRKLILAVNSSDFFRKFWHIRDGSVVSTRLAPLGAVWIAIQGSRFRLTFRRPLNLKVHLCCIRFPGMKVLDSVIWRVLGFRLNLQGSLFSWKVADNKYC